MERVQRIYKRYYLEQEITHVERALQNNDYSSKQIRKALKPKRSTNPKLYLKPFSHTSKALRTANDKEREPSLNTFIAGHTEKSTVTEHALRQGHNIQIN